MMLDDFYNELKACVKPLGVDEVHYSFVEGKIDDKKTYITYSRILKSPDYTAGVSSSSIQVSVFSKKLNEAIRVRDSISMHFDDMNTIIGNTEVYGARIENETETYDHEAKLHQVITTIRLLTNNNIKEPKE